MGLTIRCPNFSVLSKRLAKLKITCPRYIKHDKFDDSIAAIAIDSTGLKRFGHDAHGIKKNTKYQQNAAGVNYMLWFLKTTISTEPFWPIDLLVMKVL